MFDWNHQAPHIDKTDFLNGVIREKKRFENSLDDSVALGLNTGTELLMNQVYLNVLFHFHTAHFALGGTHHYYSHPSKRILSS